MKGYRKILWIIIAVIACLVIIPLCSAAESKVDGVNFKAEATAYKTGDIVEFGSYPQSRVTDKILVMALNNEAPDWSLWTSYGYYSGNGEYGSMEKGDFMRYTDVTYNGNRYRGVKFTQKRPDETFEEADNNSEKAAYNIDTVYWFKYESVNWIILDAEKGLVLSESIIDAQPFNSTVYCDENKNKYSDVMCTQLASDYKASSIRSWLNDDFYNTAFSVDEKEEISTVKLDADSSEDKVFLLSYSEVIDSDYGFSNNTSENDIARVAKGSDYAEAEGLWKLHTSDEESLYEGCSDWFLRSSGCTTDTVCCISADGRADGFYYTYSTSVGVRPALMLGRISENNH